MHKLSLALLSVLSLVIVFGADYAYANGDPVTYYSSVARVAVPEPLTISEIEIQKELVKITHEDGYNCFDVTYFFKNKSKKDFPEIHYGFPIDYLVEDEAETYRLFSGDFGPHCHEVGWNDKLIKDISFVFNGKNLQFESAKESVKEATIEDCGCDDEGLICDTLFVDGVNRRWFYTKFSVKPAASDTLTVRYKVYANSGVASYRDCLSMYSKGAWDMPAHQRYFPFIFNILYDFAPAKHFGDGKIISLDVSIDLGNLKDTEVLIDGYLCRTNYIERSYFYTKPDEMAPINLRVFQLFDKSKERILEMMRTYKIAASDYKIKAKKDKVSVKFAKPRIVTNLACDIDTAKVKQFDAVVYYADGREDKHRYEISRNYGHSDMDLRIDKPVFFNISDLEESGLGFGRNKDKMIIKKIELIFPENSVNSDFGKSVEVFDCLF